MELKKKSFILHVDSLGVLSDLSDEQAGKLFKAMLAFHKGEELDLDPLTKMAFSFFKNQFIRDNEKYIKTCEARAQAGSKGGKQKQQNLANASKCYQKEAKVAENDSDNEKDSDSDSDSESIIYAPAKADCPHDEIIALYHKILPANPRVKIWGETRKGYLKTRWREDEQRQSLEWWSRFFTYISKSEFLTGRVDQTQRKPFIADLEWIVKPSNFIKIIEGKYES